jgi:hypothetical protein
MTKGGWPTRMLNLVVATRRYRAEADMNFKDHFSKQAADYAKFRPGYPNELFAYLGSIAPSRKLAWDCGTGNGQAAVRLASVFDRVVATDASEKQIANSQPHPRVEYRVAPTENSGLDSETVLTFHAEHEIENLTRRNCRRMHFGAARHPSKRSKLRGQSAHVQRLRLWCKKETPIG